MKRELTCIVCPRGCNLMVELSDKGEVLNVSGNACKRGAVYAQNECTHPMRTVTSTIRCADGRIVPVKTGDVIPKEKVFEAMREINSVRPEGKISVGDVIIENVCGTGVCVVATANG